MNKTERLVLLSALFLLVAVRLVFLTGPLDEPSWRQVWSAYQARQLAAESPPEFFHVKMNFRGRDWVAVQNFPLYEMVVALSYKALGGESLAAARVITLLLFLGSAYYLFKTVGCLLDRRVALYTTAVYMLLPLGVFYSRAVHYDVQVLFFGQMLLYHGLRFFETERWGHFAATVISALMGFLVKAPYVIPFVCPLGVWILLQRKQHVTRLLLLGLIFVLPVILTLAFEEHRISLEGHRVSSILYPVPHTRQVVASWYLGGLSQRLDVILWMKLLRRVYWLVLTPWGLPVAAIGLIGLVRANRPIGLWCTLAWWSGALLYVLIIFPMITSEHDYYSLPLLAPASSLLGLGLAFLAGGMGRMLPLRKCASILLLGLIACGSWRGIRVFGYFTHDWQRIEGGRMVAQLTAPSDLVVCSAIGRSTGHTDPRMLFFADRLGWAQSWDRVTSENLRVYRSAGARYLAVLLTPEIELEPKMFAGVESKGEQVRLLHGPNGQVVGKLALFELEPEHSTVP